MSGYTEIITRDTKVRIMRSYHIAVIVGSLRKESFNQQLADAIVKLAPPEFSFSQVQIRGFKIC